MAECMRSIKTSKKPLETRDAFHSTISTESGVFFYVEWKIFDYFLLPLKEDLGITSPSFQFKNAVWHLLLYPKGRVHLDNTQYLHLFLVKESSPVEEPHVNFNIGIRGNDIYQSWSNDKKFIGDGASWGKHTFLCISDLERDKRELAPDGAVTFFCCLQDCSDGYSASQTSSPEGMAAPQFVRMPLKFTQNLQEVHDSFHTELFTETRSFFYVEWKVLNLLLPLENDSDVISPSFRYRNAVWHFHLYPKVRMGLGKSGYLDLSLKKEYSSIKTHPVNIIIGIRKNDIYITWRSEKTFIGDGSSSRMHTFLVSSGLKHDKRVLDPDDAVTFFCYFQSCSSRPSTSQIGTPKDASTPRSSNANILDKMRFDQLTSADASTPTSSNANISDEMRFDQLTSADASTPRSSIANILDEMRFDQQTSAAASTPRSTNSSALDYMWFDPLTSPAVSISRSSNASTLRNTWSNQSTSAAASTPRSTNSSALDYMWFDPLTSPAASTPRSTNSSALDYMWFDPLTSPASNLPRSSNASILGHTQSKQATFKDSYPETPRPSGDSHADSILTCPVCLASKQEVLASRRHFMVTRCGHMFCSSCIDKWFQRQTGQCPTCRATVYCSEILRVFL